MAELAKKLHFKKGGIEQTANAYSTVDEAGDNYVSLKIDGVACYAPLGATNDAMATNGRVLKTLYIKKVMIDNPWQQPVLSANGTMGGSEFACSVSAYNLTTSGTVGDAYGAFDNNEDTYWRSGTTSGWIQFYNPVPLKVSAIKWGYFYCYPTGGNVQGSNDGETWTTLTTWTNSSEADFTISLTQQEYYKYYRINVTGVNKDVIHAHSLTITATYQKETETYVGKDDDYDYSVTDTYAIKSQFESLPYTEVSYTTAGTHTFTVPAGVTRLRVAVCGGGGGAVGHKNLEQVDATYAPSGGSSSFGDSLTATGGNGGYIQGNPWDGTVTGGSGGTPNGNTGDSYDRYGSTYACLGGSGFLLSFEKTTVQQGSTGSYGEGGSLAYTGSTEQWSVSAGGGSGGYATNYVEVSPNTTYSISVGSAGSNTKLTSPALEYPPKSGFVLIAYGGDI